jgi:large subunit ribosomal protein L9
MSRRSINLLLIEDVSVLGRSGDIVSVKSGYARNYLIPQKKAFIADKHTLRLQEELKKKRIVLAAKDKSESEVLAKRLDGQTFALERKVDAEGHMYGSVSINDLTALLEKADFILEKRFIQLEHPIKHVGIHTISVKLKEEVSCSFILKVLPEGGVDIIDTTAQKVAAETEPTEESN